MALAFEVKDYTQETWPDERIPYMKYPGSV